MKSGKRVVMMGYENTEGGSILNREFIAESIGKNADIKIIDQSNRQEVMNRANVLRGASTVILSWDLANPLEKYDVKKIIEDVKIYNQTAEVLLVPIKKDAISSSEEDIALSEMKKFANDNKIQIIASPAPPSYDSAVENKGSVANNF